MDRWCQITTAAAARAQKFFFAHKNSTAERKKDTKKINYQFSYEYQTRISHTTDEGSNKIYSIFMGRIKNFVGL